MSTLGKILIGLNLVLAAAFFGWAANAVKTNQEWNKKYTGASEELAKAKKDMGDQISALQARATKADQDVARITGELEKAKNDKERLQNDYNDANAKNGTMQASLTTLSATYESMSADKTNLQKEKDQAEKAQRDAEAAKADAEAKRDEAEKLAAELKNNLEKANNSIADLEKGKLDLDKELKSTQAALDTLVAATGTRVDDIKAMPEISAAVLDVSNAVEPGLVALNVGSNKQVKRGFTFQIYDGKTYKGEARVEFVHPDMCSAIITSKVPGQTIRQGDSAATRL